jgi:hypothetical protein
MTFIQKSPKQLLREALGVPEPSKGRRVGDWQEFHVGQRVYDVADERHEGVITKITNSAYADIVWDVTNWRSLEIPLRNLRKTSKD